MPRTEDLWTDIYYKGTEPPVMRGREREEVREAILSSEQRAYRFFSRFTFTKPTDKMRDAGRRIDSISRRLVVDRPELRVSIHTTFLRGKPVTFESILYCRPSIISSVLVTPTSSFSSIPVDPDTPKGIQLPEASPRPHRPHTEVCARTHKCSICLSELSLFCAVNPCM